MQACLTTQLAQDDLHKSVPSLITVLGDLKTSHPALAGRLKAAALQLLPPLLDGLLARRLASASDGGESSERLQKRLCSNLAVRTSTALRIPPCLPRLHKLTQTQVWILAHDSVHAAQCPGAVHTGAVMLHMALHQLIFGQHGAAG